MEFTCAVYGNANNLFPGIDRARIEEKQRRVCRDERVEIDQHPTIQSDVCARIELRIERDANDVAVFVDAEGDTGEVTRERSQILDARLFAPQVGVSGSIGPAHMTNNLTPVIDFERGVSASARDSTEIAEIGNRAVLP